MIDIWQPRLCFKYDGLYNHTPYFPSGYKNQIIEGGNHANFGYYGKQLGDNDATITREEQTNITISAVVDFIKIKSFFLM
ncbi:MAG: hypothetical protein IJQ72_03985 [Bacilli bacterium]|nr:hypothetical protein [Bacilli bacterium]